MRETLEELERRLAALGRSPGTEIARVDLLLKICWSIRETDDWEQLRLVSGEARALAEGAGYRAGIATALAHTAYGQYVLSDFQAAIPTAVEALKLAEESASRSAESQACAVLALVYWSLGDLDSAVRFGERTRVIAEAIQDRVLTGFTYIVRGSISQSFGELEEALRWASRAFAIFKEDGFPIGQARALIVQGGVYRAMGRTQEALEVSSRALQLAQESKNRLAVSRALNDIGAVYADFGRWDDALSFYARALEIRRREGYRSAEITTLLDLAQLHKRTGDSEAAVREASSALALAAELGVKPKLAQAHRLLAELFESQGNFRQAVIHLKEYQATYSSSAHEQAAARLKTSELLASLERLRAEQSSLVESEKRTALANLAGTLAHEMNSPLGALGSSCDSTVRCVERLQRVWEGNGHNPIVSSLLEILRDNTTVLAGATRRVQSVFERFRAFAQWEDQNCAEIDVVESLERAITILGLRADVTVRRDLEPVPKLCGRAAEISHVFLQLLKNAEASISGPGEIRVTARATNDQVSVEIADTGRGIEPDRLPKLFEPGFALGDSRVKASFSLFACQHIVRKHGGEILVSSVPGRGSVFTVVLPRVAPLLASITAAHVPAGAAAGQNQNFRPN